MLINVRGIVIKQVKFNDSDSIVTIYTREHGKIQAVAKNSRNPKGKLIATTQPFVHADYVLYKGRGMYRLSQGDVVDNFYSIREDLVKLAYASYIVELVGAGTIEEEQNQKVYKMLLKILKLISNKDKDYKNLLRAFEFKFMSFIGYKPHVKECASCNEELGEKIKFSSGFGGVICEKCFLKDTNAIDLDLKAYKMILLTLYETFEEISNKSFEKEVQQAVEKITSDYIESHIDKSEFKSLKFLKAID